MLPEERRSKAKWPLSSFIIYTQIFGSHGMNLYKNNKKSSFTLLINSLSIIYFLFSIKIFLGKQNKLELKYS